MEEASGDQVDTVVARPFKSASAPGSVISHHAAAALHGEETVRARGWANIIVLLASSALAFAFVLPGHRIVKGAFVVALAILGLTSVWVRWRTRREDTYTRGVYRLFGYVAATTSIAATYYVGVFSPVPLIITLGITFFGLGMDRVHAIVLPLIALASYVVLAGLILVGVIPDLSLFPSENAALISRVFVALHVPLIYLVTLWFARLSRRTMIDAIERSNRAQLLAGKRADQLAEVQQDLERALRAGAGAAGMFTGLSAGVYELAEVIGRGAMGDVYAANRAGGGRAAVKVVRIEVAHNAKIIERFLREGSLAAQIENPHVVRVFDVGELRPGVPYIAMELLEGKDLAAIMRQGTRLSLEAVVEMLQQLADGLGAAHRAGIIHRDLKPQNVFRCSDQGATWKILDFGVSKLVGSSDTLTQGQLVGTPGYMSCEQARGLDLDARSDLFSLGAVAYRALTGAPPFPGNDLPRILFDICYVQPKRPSLMAPALSLDIERALALALAKDPADRPASAEEFASLFAAALGNKLDINIARRADELIAAHPWGSQRRGR